ncbi:MAG: OmpA family protein, partial [Elusimicrobiota bacterium]|nr:OmpA family protein [Elusimicrobiota bacterium]
KILIKPSKKTDISAKVFVGFLPVGAEMQYNISFAAMPIKDMEIEKAKTASTFAGGGAALSFQVSDSVNVGASFSGNVGLDTYETSMAVGIGITMTFGGTTGNGTTVVSDQRLVVSQRQQPRRTATTTTGNYRELQGTTGNYRELPQPRQQQLQRQTATRQQAGGQAARQQQLQRQTAATRQVATVDRPAQPTTVTRVVRSAPAPIQTRQVLTAEGQATDMWIGEVYTVPSAGTAGNDRELQGTTGNYREQPRQTATTRQTAAAQATARQQQLQRQTTTTRQAPASATRAAQPAVKSETYMISFDTNSSFLSQYMLSVIRSIAQKVSAKRYREVRVMGFSSPDYINEEAKRILTARRAEAVARELILYGIDRNKIRIESLGSQKPRFQSDTLENKVRNQRVEIVVIE